MLLHGILRFNRRRRGSARALMTDDGRILSFAALHDRSMQLARALCHSGRDGDHIAILADNQPAYVEVGEGSGYFRTVTIVVENGALVEPTPDLLPTEFLERLMAAHRISVHFQPRPGGTVEATSTHHIPGL